MKKLVSFFLFIFCASFQINAQWNSLVKTPFGESLYSVHFINSTTEWNLNNTGKRILKTIVDYKNRRNILTLINKEKLAGNYKVDFSAKSRPAYVGNASSLPSAICFYRTETGKFFETKKLIILK